MWKYASHQGGFFVENYMKNDILSLAKQLIAVPSVTRDDARSLEVLEIVKRHLQGYTYTHFISHTIHSLIYTNKPIRKNKFKIILNAHLDVVPGKQTQFKPFTKNGKLYGRGAYDMKGAASTMILLFNELARKISYPLGLQIVTDEENGDVDGTKYQIEKGIRADFVIIGEGTNLRIIHAAKGMLIVRLIATGKTSHGAYPWRGDNAFLKMQQTISALYKKYPVALKETHTTTVNVAHIHTENKAYNKTPDVCEAIIDIRYVNKEKKTILQTLQACLSAGVTYKIVHHLQSHQVNSDNSYIKHLRSGAATISRKEIVLASAHGTSDLPHYSAAGCEGVEFGPIGGNPHQDDEWVDIESLQIYDNILKHFLLSMENDVLPDSNRTTTTT